MFTIIKYFLKSNLKYFHCMVHSMISASISWPSKQRSIQLLPGIFIYFKTVRPAPCLRAVQWPRSYGLCPIQHYNLNTPSAYSQSRYLSKCVRCCYCCNWLDLGYKLQQQSPTVRNYNIQVEPRYIERDKFIFKILV